MSPTLLARFSLAVPPFPVGLRLPREAFQLSIRQTPPLALTLSAHFAVGRIRYVGLDCTDNMRGSRGFSACKSSQLPMFSRLRRYQEYFEDNPSGAWVCYVSVSLSECSLCSRSFPKSLVKQDGAVLFCQSRMSHLGPGGGRSGKPRFGLRQQQLETA
jgi:hypothetical protein